jgi:hypothetical protein
LSALPPLAFSCNCVATDNVEAPPHHCESRQAATDGAKEPSFAPLQLMSSCEKITTDDAEAPHIRGPPTAPDNLVMVARRD